ncbi:MAG: indolepyruvate oxidoreductase subunit beta [Oscillospiraceae bacterium]|jgi:indolepyruvate ferredoxin oxidoreductase beta subunit
MKSCLLCGVGGQGTVLASRILASAAMEEGLFARTAETIGMAQRGGCVVSHVRMGETVPSPMIPFGQADMILGFEPGEAVRCLPYLKPDGWMIVCKKAVQPVAASLSGSTYDGDAMVAYLQKKVANCIVIDGEAICRTCGSEKVLNVALVGAAIQSGVLGLKLESIETILATKLKAAFIEQNRKALHLGAAAL